MLLFHRRALTIFKVVGPMFTHLFTTMASVDGLRTSFRELMESFNFFLFFLASLKLKVKSTDFIKHKKFTTKMICYFFEQCFCRSNKSKSMLIQKPVERAFTPGRTKKIRTF